MKKIITLLTFCLLGLNFSVHGQVFTEDFQGGTVPPTGWTEMTGTINSTLTGTTSSWTDDTFGNSGTTSAKNNLYSNTTGQWLITPSIDLGTGNGYQLEFDVSTTEWNSSTDQASFESTDTLSVVISLDDGATWVTSNVLQSWLQGTEASVAGDNVIIDLSAYSGIVKFGFYAVASSSTASDFDAFFDNIIIRTPPTCADVSTIMASSITATQADIAWTENGTATSWVIEYGPTGFTTGSGTTLVTGNNPETISSLTADTDYQVYVRAICGPGDTSAYVSPVAFSTPCAAIAPAYFTDFSTFLPSCWDEASDGTPLTGPTGLGGGLWAQSLTRARVNLFTDDRREWLLTPSFDLSAGGWELVIDANATDYSNSLSFAGMGSDDTVQVLVSTDNGISWSAIHTWDVTNPLTLASSPEIIDLSAYTGTDILFGIWASDGSVNDPEDYYVYVNSFEIRTPPSCIEVSSINTSNITDSQVDVAWTENGTATEWAIEYGPTGFTPGTGNSVVTTNNPETVTGLMETTDYDFYVRAICGSGDTSQYTGPVSISTPCAVITPAYLTDFSTFMPSCWDEATNGTVATGPTGLGTGSWGQSGTTARINLYTTGTSDWLVAPSFDLSAGGWQLVVTAEAYDYSASSGTFSGMGSDDSVQVLVSADNGTTWSIIHSWNTTTPLIAGPTPTIIDLSAYSGTNNMFGIRATEGTTNDLEDYYAVINSFEIRVIPPCNDVTALLADNVTSTEAELSWTENGTATEWAIEYGITGFTPGAGTSVITGNNPETISGLTSYTDYDFYVRAICGVGDTSGYSIVASFSTDFVDTMAVAECDTYTWSQNGMSYTMSGFYYDSLVSVNNGSDSIYVLDLTINNSTSDTTIEVACETYTWAQNGMTYTMSGFYYDSLVSVATGCDSVFVLDLTINTSTSDTTVEVACETYTWAQNGMTYTTSGFYYDSLVSVTTGCDSVFVLDLTIDVVGDLSVTETGGTITATNTTADSYQWIDCSDNSVIAGETGPSFTATVSGDYAVIISNGICSDTSDCVNVDYSSIDENSLEFSIYPNPNNGEFSVKTDAIGGTLTVVSLDGKIIESNRKITNSITNLNYSEVKTGVYLIKIQKDNQVRIERIVIR